MWLLTYTSKGLVRITRPSPLNEEVSDEKNLGIILITRKVSQHNESYDDSGSKSSRGSNSERVRTK